MPAPIQADRFWLRIIYIVSIVVSAAIAFLILGGVSFPTIVLFLIIKVLHELDIHSGIKSSLYRHLPFAGINEYHALHHKYQDVHFASVFSLWDWVFRTNYLSKTAKK